MADNQKYIRANIRDINALEHITSDVAKSRSNYESILNGLVAWNTTDNPNVTVRLSTDNYPYFVDYTFPSRSTFATGGGTVAEEGLYPGIFDYANMIDMVATTSDEATLRLTVASGNRGSWTLFEEAMVTEDGTTASMPYKKGQFIRRPNTNTGTYLVCVATADIDEGTTLDESNTRKVVTRWKIDDYASYGEYPGTVTFTVDTSSDTVKIVSAYVLRGPSTNAAPGRPNSAWERIADSISGKKVGTMFEPGKLYIYSSQDDLSDAALYMYIGDPKEKPADNSLVPVDEHGELDDKDWYGPVIMVPVTNITRSAVLHHVPTTDINGFILRSNSYDTTSVSAISNLAVHEGTSEPNKGLKIFGTSNYARWPDTESRIWHTGIDYSTSSHYTAEMVFHHASDEVKTCNIVNYDGPDLDRGLAIYLPVNDRIVGDNGEDAYVEPKDGAMFEFLFRIWPNTAYNGATTPDLIINKAQIYVYSAKRSDELDSARVLAKFSMARLTNFYLWAENVAVPARPVFYKAKFIYSRDDKEWRTYDYYQVPDHVFLSPKGFVDPANRNDDTYGEDGDFSGVQTAGFPLMQDPFAELDMSPVRMNRIEHND
jgi:hypothetical protein